MRPLSLTVVAIVLMIPLLSSCASTGTATFMKAGFDRQDSEGWASKYIPGISALSRLVPPPTEARLKWDQEQKRLGHPGSGQDRQPEF
jgi:hypothetical protein